MNWILSFDNNVFSVLYHLSGRSALVDRAIVFFADKFIFIVIALVVLWYIARFAYNRIRISDIATLVGSLLFTTVAYTLLKNLVERARPFVALGIPHLVNDSSYAFPSGHTATMFALATAVWFRDRTAGYLVGICGLLVGIARVAGGVHWPSDILGGVVLGIIVGVLVEFIVSKIFIKRGRLMSKRPS